jgi:HAD superfamily hydrolase (TIGR01509 family)
LKRLGKVNIKKGLKNLIDEIRLKGILTALATSNTYFIVERVFDELGIKDLFDIVTTSEEVSFNKPSPEIYSLTADKLAVAPQECIVIEDAQAGIEAAHAAGMKVVALIQAGTIEKPIDADMVINNFTELSPDILEALVMGNK